MNKLITPMIICCVFAFAAKSQNPFYEVKTATGTYEPLQSASWHVENPDKDYEINSLPGFKIFDKI